MTKIDCNCIDGKTKLYIKNLILSDIDDATSNMQIALGLSNSEDVPNIMKSYELIKKKSTEILLEIDKIRICKSTTQP